MRAIFRIYLKECFVYPGASLIWVIADSQALVLPAVWIAAAGPGELIAGMTSGQIVAYYLTAMTLSQFVVCHLLWDIGWDIREGHFSSQIVRPFSFFWFSFARNIAWRIAKIAIFVPILVLLLLSYGGWRDVQYSFKWTFWLSLILAQTLSFVAAYCVAMIPLWTTEYFSAYRLYYIPEYFLSGRLVPLNTLPLFLQGVGTVLWFRYTIALPTDVLLGRISDEAAYRGLQFQVVWIAVFGILGGVLFRKGVKNYSGAGM